MTLSPADSSGAGYPLGLAGAQTGTRFVGGTASGAPVSGTFEVGDYVVAQDGSVYICTAAGSPGTWVAVSGGGGGGYLLAAATWTTAEVALGSNTVIGTAPAVALDGSTPVAVDVYTPAIAGNASATLHLFDAVDGGAAASLGNIYDGAMAGGYVGNGAVSLRVALVGSYTPAAGSHVYSFRGSSAAASVYAGAGGAGTRRPGSITVTSLPSA